MAEERIQKLLAHAGHGSRRSCEKIIEAGRIRVNGKVAKLGDKADIEKDTLTLDNLPIELKVAKVYYALYKPRFVLSSSESQGGHKTVLDYVKSPQKIYPVGRLDLESEGLMILTNDGDFTNQLSHPRYGHEKEYHVLVSEKPDKKQLDTWQRGVILEDGYHTQRVELKYLRAQGKGAWLKVVMTEGRKRQIRETARLIGLTVVKLIRVRIGSLKIGNLKPGESRPLTTDEVTILNNKRPTSKNKFKPNKKKYDR